VTLAGLAMMIFSSFYRANIAAYPAFIGIILAGPFISGVFLRRRRRHLHRLAYSMNTPAKRSRQRPTTCLVCEGSRRP
jgi:hypothetical protein